MGAHDYFQEYLETQGRLDNGLLMTACRTAATDFRQFIINEKWKSKRMRISHPIAWLVEQDQRVQEDMAKKYLRDSGMSPQVCTSMEKIIMGALADVKRRMGKDMAEKAAGSEKNHDSAKEKMAFPPGGNVSLPQAEKKKPRGNRR